MLPPNARENSDGSLSFPVRGELPSIIPGYVEDPNDDHRWILDYIPCVHRRVNEEWTCPSGKTRLRDFCPLIGLKINPKYCKEACPFSQEVRSKKT